MCDEARDSAGLAANDTARGSLTVNTKARHTKGILQGPARWVPILGLAFLVGFATGCDNLLEVELPGAVTEDDLLTPELAETAVLSAMADFECAYAEFAISLGGLEDAFWESTGWFTRAWSEYRVDRTTGAVNTQECGVSDVAAGFYVNFQAARFQAEQAYAFLQDMGSTTDETEQLLAQAALTAGFTYDVFGESWCSMAVNLGPEMTPAQTLDSAEAWFGRALSHIGTTGDFETANTTSVEDMAYLGRARVRYALGDDSGAATDAAQVDDGFTAVVTRGSSDRKRWNQVYQHLTVSKYGTVPPQVDFEGSLVAFTGYRDLTIAADGRAVNADGSPVMGTGTPDPRVPVENTGQLGQDGVTPHWIQTKYTSYDDPIVFARWEEAQLILAELEGGQSAIDRVNAIRAAHSLPAVTYLSAGDTAGIRDMILEERRRTFFYEGRWHSDKLRNSLFFPEGLGFNHKGVAYGEATCLELSERERESNPNLT